MPLRAIPSARALNLLRHPILIALGSAGIFNLLPIAYAFQPQLRGRLTQGRRSLPWNPWTFGEEDSHLFSRYLCCASSLVCAPVLLTVYLQCTYNALLPLHLRGIHNFGSMLSPVYFRRKISRLVSCYALFK